MKQVTLTVEGMSCNHCVNSVEGALKNAGASGTVDLASGTVSIEYDDSKVSLDALKEAIEDQGYDVVS
ncbi:MULTISPECIES: cation transporter [Paenibacillus]|jgi:copper chaperone|uniref:Copper ion binding protein n=2 Tax=Paenibacillus lactis TaxID=228574 RepID=G4HHA8_9BACL|nr:MULTISPECIES: cation transporter [Paenibacillus]EHB63484.1 copper ion binding protein [Paenibacillus lactis 154]MBP1891765.1 copper chaperone [Paenibacillus lactis]HAF99214.1 copper chaperone [Paenibacillus lactis]